MEGYPEKGVASTAARSSSTAGWFSASLRLTQAPCRERSSISMCLLSHSVVYSPTSHMAHPVNTGWQGGPPVVLTHEDGEYRAPSLGSISSTSFSFEETSVRAPHDFKHRKPPLCSASLTHVCSNLHQCTQSPQFVVRFAECLLLASSLKHGPSKISTTDAFDSISSLHLHKPSMHVVLSLPRANWTSDSKFKGMCASRQNYRLLSSIGCCILFFYILFKVLF